MLNFQKRDTKTTVDWLLISLDNSYSACAQKVHNLDFMRKAKISMRSYERVVQAFYSGLMTNIFRAFTPLNPLLCTSSTEPIKTIYLNKEA